MSGLCLKSNREPCKACEQGSDGLDEGLGEREALGDSQISQSVAEAGNQEKSLVLG